MHNAHIIDWDHYTIYNLNEIIEMRRLEPKREMISIIYI